VGMKAASHPGGQAEVRRDEVHPATARACVVLPSQLLTHIQCTASLRNCTVVETDRVASPRSLPAIRFPRCYSEASRCRLVHTITIDS